MTNRELAGRALTRTARWCRPLCSVAFACLATLALTGQARATSYSPSDAFYFSVPTGAATAIAVSPDGNFVYVVNGPLKRIEEFDSDGVFVRNWAENKTLQAPSSVTTDGFGDVYVLYPHPLNQAPATIVKYTEDGKKILTSWTVPFAGSIAATRGGSVFVLTNFLNAVGEYNTNGKSLGGFVADLPGQWFPALPSDPEYAGSQFSPQSGYDPPYKTVAKEIAVDPSGDPMVVGASYQALSDPQPDCSSPDSYYHINTQPYPDPLVSGEAVRFTPGGTPIAYGWLTGSQQSCIAGFYQQSPGLSVAFGWQSDATNPLAVAVDPNTGEVYSVSDDNLGVIHLLQSLENTNANVNAPSYYCNSLDCSARDWDLIAGNPPTGVTLDCRSNLYMLGGGAAGQFVTKFIDQDPAPPDSCVNLSRFKAPPPSLAVFKLHVGKIGKGTVWSGCSGRLCNGTLSLVSNSPLCRNCTLSRPRHFRIPPGVQRPLSLKLTALGRRMLRAHPGIAVKIVGRVKGGRRFAVDEILRGPATLAERCAFPGSSGGTAGVSGTLTPAHRGEQITVQYLPPESSGLLIPAVQRTAFTDRAGRFHERYSLDAAGRWTIVVNWAGDRTHEPTASQPCSGTVEPVQTQITLTCPSAASAGAPAQFAGGITGAPAGAPIDLAYVAPPTTDLADQVSTGSAGNFSDSFSPTAPGVWLALATYKGDAGHAPASGACQFTVAPAPSTLTLQCTPDPNRRFIACTGDLTSDGAGIGGAPVSVTYQPPGGGSSTVDSATTAADGSYSDTLHAPVGSPLASGDWQVRAQFAGDGTHGPAANTQSVTVP